MKTGDVSDIKCLHFSCQYHVWLISNFWSMSATDKPGKWKSLSRSALERWPIFTHLLGRFTSADYAGHGSVPMKTAFPATLRLFMSIQQELYMHCELVRCFGSLPTSLCSTHTSVWCKVFGSSHNHPPATNAHLSGAPAGDFFRVVVCRRGTGRGRHLTPDFPPPLSGSIFIYWSLEVSIYSIKTSSEVRTGA